jgi:Domain of unknown function (DUF4438)
MPPGRVMAIHTNRDRLVKVAVVGRVAPQEFEFGWTTPYLISHEGAPRIVPGTGGITYNVRVGDRIAGLVGDHIEPAVSARNPDPKANAGFNILSCVGNRATVISGDAKGAQGVVTGTHGGIEHVMIDFPDDVLARMAIGDKIQVAAWGVGLEIAEFPNIRCTGLDPGLLERWVTETRNGKLVVPVARMAPAAIMGSGLGRDNVARADYDITLFDPALVAQYGLDELRFGDFVAILDADSTYGRHYYTGAISVGIIVHGDSYIAGHGPGGHGVAHLAVGRDRAGARFPRQHRRPPRAALSGWQSDRRKGAELPIAGARPAVPRATQASPLQLAAAVVLQLSPSIHFARHSRWHAQRGHASAWIESRGRPCYRSIQGSSASRRPSPRKLNASTVRESASAGETSM